MSVSRIQASNLIVLNISIGEKTDIKINILRNILQYKIFLKIQILTQSEYRKCSKKYNYYLLLECFIIFQEVSISIDRRPAGTKNQAETAAEMNSRNQNQATGRKIQRLRSMPIFGNQKLAYIQNRSKKYNIKLKLNLSSLSYISQKMYETQDWSDNIQNIRIGSKGNQIVVSMKTGNLSKIIDILNLFTLSLTSRIENVLASNYSNYFLAKVQSTSSQYLEFLYKTTTSNYNNTINIYDKNFSFLYSIDLGFNRVMNSSLSEDQSALVAWNKNIDNSSNINNTNNINIINISNVTNSANANSSYNNINRNIKNTENARNISFTETKIVQSTMQSFDAMSPIIKIIFSTLQISSFAIFFLSFINY